MIVVSRFIGRFGKRIISSGLGVGSFAETESCWPRAPLAYAAVQGLARFRGRLARIQGSEAMMGGGGNHLGGLDTKTIAEAAADEAGQDLSIHAVHDNHPRQEWPCCCCRRSLPPPESVRACPLPFLITFAIHALSISKQDLICTTLRSSTQPWHHGTSGASPNGAVKNLQVVD